MLEAQTNVNPKVNQVVTFHNKEVFGFTPEMGCMFDGKAIIGENGLPGIEAGETIILQYPIGLQLATNLAKVAMTRLAPSTDPSGTPTGIPLWDTVKLERMRDSYLTDLYMGEKPKVVSEADAMMAKIDEMNKFMRENVVLKTDEAPKVETPEVTPEVETPVVASKTYLDKAEVIAELTKRGITHDKRSNKANLEKLLA